MHYQNIVVPTEGRAITLNKAGKLEVPNRVIIPYIEGDGIGVDITPAMKQVVDAAVLKAYEGKRAIAWMEIYAGEKATQHYGATTFLPQETLDALKRFLVAIKGPLTTPVGGGIRSINVSLRQQLDLYTCLRPIRYLQGTPSPVKEPEAVNMVIFRENAEDIYAGIEWAADSIEAKQVIRFLQETMHVTQIRFPDHCGIGIKPVSKNGSMRLIRQAIQYAIDHGCPTVTLVHKGNIMKFTEGAFKEWGYELAREAFGATPLEGGPWHTLRNPKNGQTIVINDMIADAFFQQILLRPREFSVIATLNLNGDYLSDALAAQVGGIGMAPGANLSDSIALFEATHGTAPKHAGLNRANPSSLILSAQMMLLHMGWDEAAHRIMRAMEATILEKTVTYDLERLMKGATLLSTSAFAAALIAHL